MVSNNQLTAVILTLNEADHITECIASLNGWIENVIVWDSVSTDQTCTLARAAGATVMERPFDNYAAQRQAVLDALDTEWILFIDADERATSALATEIQTLLADDQQAGRQQTVDGYWIPRRNFIVGYEMKAGGFYPDYQLRLLRREQAKYVAEREVHEIVEVVGEEGYLREPLIHHNYADWTQFHHKQRTYAAYEAKILAERGIHPRPHNFILQPLREGWRRFIKLQGWRDGWHGLRLAFWLAWYYGFMPYQILKGQGYTDAH